MLLYFILFLTFFVILVCAFKNEAFFTKTIFAGIGSSILLILVNCVYFAINYDSMDTREEVDKYNITGYNFYGDDIIYAGNVCVVDRGDLINDSELVISNDSTQVVERKRVFFGGDNDNSKWILYPLFPIKETKYVIRTGTENYEKLTNIKNGNDEI